MLRLEIDNIAVFINPKQKIPLYLKNPFFNPEGTFSYPLNALVDRNRAIFKHLEAEDNFEEYTPPFKMWIDDELFAEGEVRIIESNKEFIQFYLKAGKSSAARILKESFLDDTINGQSWGDNPGGLTDINNSPNNIYPTNKFVVVPVKLDEEVINEWDVDNQQLLNPSLGDGKITPMVYLRHIIDRINQALTLFNDRNDFRDLQDFNRVCIFSPRRGNFAADGLQKYAEWLPHITAADFLNDLEQRYNIAAFFQPLLFAVDYIKFDELLNGDIIDWTKKFVRNNAVNVFAKGFNLLSNNVPEDIDGLSPREIEEKYDLTEVATYDDMSLILGNSYKVLDKNRYFQVVNREFDNDLKTARYVDVTNSFPLVDYIISQKNEDVATRGNLFNTPNTLNAISSFIYEKDKGVVNDNVLIENFIAKTDINEDVELIAIIYVYDYSTSTSNEIGRKSITINSTTYLQLRNIQIPVVKAGQFEPRLDGNNVVIGGSQLRITLYSYHPTDSRRITVQCGDMSLADLPFFGTFTEFKVDADRKVFEEIGIIGNYEFGGSESENLNAINPESNILYNKSNNNNNYSFQFPISDIEPEIEQSDFAYTIFRGKINDESNQGKTIPYCNFDDVDIELRDYQGRLTGGSTPDLSLRWHGEKGLVSNFYINKLIWFTNYRRPVRKIFKLSLHDLITLKMYNRIRVDNVLYLINSIKVNVDVNGKLSTSEIEMFTV